MKRSFLIGLAVVLGFLAGEAGDHVIETAEARTVIASEADNGGSITLGSGDRLVLRLGAQLGTGFSWVPASSEYGPLRLSDQRVEPSPGTAPGATETQVFTFVPIATGTGALRFVYRRPWLPEEPPARSFSLNVIVQ